jgi:hypothetical protein
MDSDEPSDANSNTEREEPRRALPITEIEDPNRENIRMANDDPK